MRPEELENLILEDAIEKTKGDFVASNDSNKDKSAVALALESLDKHFEGKSIAETTEVAQHVQYTVRAAAFTTTVLSSLYMRERMKRNIHEFIMNPDNEHLFIDDSLKNAAEDSMDASEDIFDKLEKNGEKAKNAREKIEKAKQDLEQKLVDKVTEKFNITAKTHQGKAFMEKMESEFANAVTPEDCAELFSRGITATNDLLTKMGRGENIKATAMEVKADVKNRSTSYSGNMTIEKSHSLEDTILDSLATFSGGLLSTETVGLSQTVNSDSVIYISEQADIDKITSLLQSHKDSKIDEWLANEENSLWISLQVGGSEVNSNDQEILNSVLLNGKPMFDSHDITNLTTDQKKARILGSALAGDKITFFDMEDDHEVNFTPEFKDIREKPFWEKIVDFLKDLIGIGELSEAKQNINKVKEDNSKDKKAPVKTSFKEMSELNGLTTKTTKKPTEPVAQKKAPEMDHK